MHHLPGRVEQHGTEIVAGLRPVRHGAFQRDHFRIRALREHADIHLHQMHFDEVSRFARG